MRRVSIAAAVIGLALASACSSTSTTKTTPADAASGTGGSGGGAGGSAGSGAGGSSAGDASAGSGGASGSAGSGGSSGSSASGGAAGSGGADGGGSDAAVGPTTDGLLLWLDATSGVTTTAEGFVASWADRSGNGRDAVQLVAAARPKGVIAGGRPTVEFDGVDDRLDLPPGFANWQAGLSAFLVLRPAVDSCQQVLHLSNGPEQDDVSVHIEPGLSFLYEVFRSYLETTSGVLAPNTAALVGVVHQPAGRAETRLNGLVAISNPAFALPENLPRSINAVGDGEYDSCGNYSGQLSELLLYGRDLSPAETSAVEAYLQAKWACCTP